MMGLSARKIQLTLGDLQWFFALGHLMRGERECRSEVPKFQIDLREVEFPAAGLVSPWVRSKRMVVIDLNLAFFLGNII